MGLRVGRINADPEIAEFGFGKGIDHPAHTRLKLVLALAVAQHVAVGSRADVFDAGLGRVVNQLDQLFKKQHRLAARERYRLHSVLGRLVDITLDLVDFEDGPLKVGGLAHAALRAQRVAVIGHLDDQLTGNFVLNNFEITRQVTLC